MAMPPLQLSLASSAKTGDLTSMFGADGAGAGMSVNFGDGVSQGNSLPDLSPMLLGAVVLVAVLWIKNKK